VAGNAAGAVGIDYRRLVEQARREADVDLAIDVRRREQIAFG
jgi:hypothetical protein